MGDQGALGARPEERREAWRPPQEVRLVDVGLVVVSEGVHVDGAEDPVLDEDRRSEHRAKWQVVSWCDWDFVEYEGARVLMA